MPRPRKHLRPSDYQKLEGMASVGASKATIARRLGIGSVKTFNRILGDDKRATDAWEAGRGQLETDLVRCLYDAAMNGNITSAIYLTKAMCGFTDQPQPQAAESRIEVMHKLVMPAALTEREWNKLQATTASPKELKEVGSRASGS